MPAGAVGRQKGRRMLLRDRALRLKPSGLLVDPETRERRAGAMPDIQHLAVGADRHDRGPAGGRRLGLARELTGIDVHREAGDLLVVLQANVESMWHRFPPAGSFQTR